jgi:hypothetical protein
MSSNALREIIAFFGIEVDDKDLKKGEKGVHGFTSTLKEFGETLVAAFAVEKIVEFTKELIEEANVLAKQSLALSVSAEELEGWQWAAKLSGSSAEEFNSAFTKFNKNVGAASKGTGPAADALRKLGITAADLKTKLPIDLLDDVADGLVKMQDPAKRTETIMALFGRSGSRLLPLFLKGADGIKQLREEVAELGGGFDAAFLDNAQEIKENVERLQLGVKGLAIQAIGPLLPDLVALTKQGITWIKWVVELLKHTNSLKAGLLTFATTAVIKTTTGLVSLAQKAGFLKNGFKGLLLEVLPLIAAFLILEDVWTFLTGGKSVTGDLITRFFGKNAVAEVRIWFDKVLDFGAMAFDKLKEIFGDSTMSFRERLDAFLTYLGGAFAANFTGTWSDIVQDIVAIFKVAFDAIAATIDGIVWAVKGIKGATDALGITTASEDEDTGGGDDAGDGAPAPPISDQEIADAFGQGKPAPAKPRRAGGKPKWFPELSGVAGALGAPAGQPAAPSGGPSPWAPQAPAPSPWAQLPPTWEVPHAAASAQVPTGPQELFPPPNVHNETHLVQNIDASTPKDVRDAAAEGAKKGVGEGNNLRTKRALVPHG